MNGLALLIQEGLRRDPHAGDLYVFRGVGRADLIKILWHDGLGMSLYAKRLEKGRFIWPSPADGVVAISAAQLAPICSTESTGAIRARHGGRKPPVDRRNANLRIDLAGADRVPGMIPFVA